MSLTAYIILGVLALAWLCLFVIVVRNELEHRWFSRVRDEQPPLGHKRLGR